MIFEGKTLEEVYQKASDHFGVSVSKLQITTIQAPSKGLFGFFAKKAIIEAKSNEVETKQKQEIKETIETIEKPSPEKENQQKDKQNIKEEKKEITEVNENNEVKPEYFEYEIEQITIEDVVELVKKEVNELFKLSCFNIDEIDVKVYDDETIIFIVNGEDAALLIGKEGYRYNALSTMLFNWISQKYGYKVKLEIAEFLEQQEEMMRKLLEPYIREIEEKGRCKTKAFDGVLAYLAVEILRSEFPDKYVAIKKNRDGNQYVVVNRFLNKNE
jgi:spoIIIJ-associated protein